MTTQSGYEQQILGQLTQLREEFPAWWFQHRDSTVAWVAQRRHHDGQTDGVSRLEASSAELLREELLEVTDTDADLRGQR